jgi:hypothetical protein
VNVPSQMVFSRNLQRVSSTCIVVVIDVMSRREMPLSYLKIKVIFPSSLSSSNSFWEGG